MKLRGDGEVLGITEELCRTIGLDGESFTGALTVGGCDDGRVGLLEPLAEEELGDEGNDIGAETEKGRV
jgi:hypothetical protein